MSMSSKSSLKVDWCSDAAAKFACKNWHYSKSLPAGKLAKLGAWEDGSFIGCIVFGWGANKNMAQVYGLKQTECAELVRIALTDHKNTVSRIMAVSIKFLKRQSPGVRLLVSYADPAQGHHGGVYQATNWMYSGSTGKTSKYLYQGKQLHQRQVSKTGYFQQFGKQMKCPRVDECEKIITPGKHKYLYPLDNEISKQIESLSKPYPKPASDKGIG
jgi:hypothetical protein